MKESPAATRARWLARASRRAVLLFLLAGTVLGVLLADDYGESWDERDTTVYGRQAWEAWREGAAPSDWHKNAEYYGPFYLALVEGGVDLAQSTFPSLPSPFVRHFLYYEAFLFSIPWLYQIARRAAGAPAALLGTALYATQPVLFGQSFINPKDMPLMALTVGAVAAGLAWIDRSDADAAPETRGQPKAMEVLRDTWTRSSRRARFWVLGLAAIGILAALDLLVLHQVLAPGAQALLAAAYAGRAGSPMGWIFDAIASRAGDLPLEVYAEKLATLERWLRLPLAILAFLPATLVGWATWGRGLSRIRALPVLGQAVLAGALVGMATSVRVVGPWAGLLITVLWLIRKRSHRVAAVAVYWASAAAVAIATWPYLWGAPLANFLTSLSEMASFEWNHSILFAGRVLLAPDLPRYALPFFFAVKTTEPALLLAALGVFILLRDRRSPGAPVGWMAAIWIGLPIAAATVLHPVIYDGGRQYLFLLPAAFVLCAVGSDRIFAGGRRGLPLIVAVLALAPGLLGILRLHPYEYIYYNALVGGVPGANRRYELDYWATSYREAMQAVNHLAAPNVWVAVSGPWQLAADWARPDLKVYRPISEAPGAEPAPSFAILTSRSNGDWEHYPQAAVVAEITAGGGTLAVVREFELPSPPPPVRSPASEAVGGKFGAKTVRTVFGKAG